jgi:hypothetical protein
MRARIRPARSAGTAAHAIAGKRRGVAQQCRCDTVQPSRGAMEMLQVIHTFHVRDLEARLSFGEERP